ncbi:MAG: DUF4199 domain-containing protein [Bacteroidetes bacterium]|nr:DUF4199 domain-containing protein [Bacteroidota bacterium]
MKKTIIYGLIAGLFVTLVMDIGMANIYDTDKQGSMLFGYTTMLVAFSLIFVSIKSYRDRNGGFISFGRAFQIGLWISLIASTMYVMGWMIEYYVFFPDFYDKSEIHSLAKMKAAGATPALVQAKEQYYDQVKQMVKNPVVHVLMTYVEILPVGLLVSVVAALILKRRAGNPNLVV